MESHVNREHFNRASEEFLQSLKQKADKMTLEGKNTIAVGKPEEHPLTEYDSENGVFVRRMPEDEHGIIRVSVGGGDNLPVKGDYCTFRGNAKQAVKLLHKAIQAIEQAF